MLLKFENEREWLAQRKLDVTSTEVAAMLGLSDYKSRLKLWYIKKGEIEDDFEETKFTKWGSRLQGVIVQGICEDEGYAAQDLTGLYLRDPSSRLGASMDALAIAHDGRRLLFEAKKTSAFSPELGWSKESAPVSYEFQIQCQMHLAIKDGQDINGGIIGALGDRSDTRVYYRQYDPELGAMLEKESIKFWRSIELNETPEPDYLVDGELLGRLRGSVNTGQNISLTGNNRAHELIEKYMVDEEVYSGYIRKAKEVKTDLDRIKNEIHDLMKTAETALIGDYRVKAAEQTVEEKLVGEYKFRRFDIKKMKRK